MDIEKEREAFEKECRSLCYKGNMVMSSLGNFYNNEQTNWMWQMWLSSKNQAIPEGFVVVPKEPTQKMIDAADNCAINGKVTANIIYKSMVEDQEPK